MQVEVSIGNIKTKISYNNEEGLNVINNVVKELNGEYNKIISYTFGKADEIVLLSFLLFETGMKLYNSTKKTQEDNVCLFLKSINKYIQNNANEKMSEKNRLYEIEKTKEMLVVANIIKKIELVGKNSDSSSEYNEFSSLINTFTKDIKTYIEDIKNDILLH